MEKAILAEASEGKKMTPLEQTYSYRYFRGRAKNLSWRAPIVCKAIIDVLKPKSVIDVGCAVGDLVKGFLDLGVDAMGLEGSPSALPYMMVPLERVVQWDLRQPIFGKYLCTNPTSPDYKGRRWDTVTCFEVAEHIEEESEGVFAWTVSRKLCDRWLVISAAPPGQDGVGHVNLKPQSYWVNLFSRIGFEWRPIETDLLKTLWFPWKDKKGIKAYYQNVMVFERGT